MKLGKTGDYPHGKSREDDEGALQFAIGHNDRLVELHFGTPVAWCAMPADIARQMAHALLQHADAVDPPKDTRNAG